MTKPIYNNYYNRQPLVSIYNHTVAYCNKIKLPAPKSFVYNYEAKEFKLDEIFKNKIKLNKPAEIIVENIDSFDMARKIGDLNGLPLVLNLASHQNFGGGVTRGARAQEEDLFRKSNYTQVMDKNFYPLKINEVVYSPLVYVVKDSIYKLLDQPFAVSCLAVAAIRDPEIVVDPNGMVHYKKLVDVDIMEEKIDMVFKIAIKHGHSNLVLGALGCGAFNNPPEDVAIMFKNAITKYQMYFDKICFAVLSKQGNNNFEIYNKILKN